MMKRKIGLLAVAGAAVFGSVAATPSLVSAATGFSGNYATTSCPNGYGCIQGWNWTQGWNYGASENHWSDVSIGNGETQPSNQMRNRNNTSLRSVVIRQSVGGTLHCTVLEHDDRGWVTTPSGRKNATTMKGAGNTVGCTVNTYI